MGVVSLRARWPRRPVVNQKRERRLQVKTVKMLLDGTWAQAQPSSCHSRATAATDGKSLARQSKLLNPKRHQSAVKPHYSALLECLGNSRNMLPIVPSDLGTACSKQVPERWQEAAETAGHGLRSLSFEGGGVLLRLRVPSGSGVQCPL